MRERGILLWRSNWRIL